MSARRAFVAPLALALAALAAGSPSPARAGEGTDNCTGFITAIPATIATQGVWCLSADLSMSQANWHAIEVEAPNVTVDCNGHRLVSTAGAANFSIAVRSMENVNTTVRDCSIHDFAMGVAIGGGGGHLVEDNHFRGIRATAVSVTTGSNNLVRRNRIENTGGSQSISTTGVIRANADIVDNTINGLAPQTGNSALTGIVVLGPDLEVSRNAVRGFTVAAGLYAIGIQSAHPRTTVADNTIVYPTSSSNSGISMGGAAASSSICVGNRVTGFLNPLVGCTHSLDNGTPAP